VLLIFPAEFVKTPDEWIPIKGSLEAIGRLSQAGYEIVVITNQSGVGRGHFSADMLAKMHAKMIDHIQQHGGINLMKVVNAENQKMACTKN